MADDRVDVVADEQHAAGPLHVAFQHLVALTGQYGGEHRRIAVPRDQHEVKAVEVAEARFRHEHVNGLELQHVPGRVEAVDGDRLEPGIPEGAANRGARVAVRMNNQSDWLHSLALHNISKPLQRFRRSRRRGGTAATAAVESCGSRSTSPWRI